eukprot:TRINITY_DN4632_c0_g1_i1.p1 TRINITY_DN4632_c0_g1~~TRINITY_DN4632_c0_g1_i1.p1  ORF type:complete len:192 (-),score=42.63 TRINITY_DN4632_c0_g1_i1:211-786(-)
MSQQEAFVEEFGPVINVTLTWAIFYYSFAFMQGQVKTGGLLPGSEAYKHFLDRLFGNLFEQSIAFIPSLWLYAASVDAQGAANCGWAWLFFRFGWLAVWAGAATPKAPGDKLPMVTMPMYFIIFFFMVTPVLHHGLLFGMKFNLQSLLGGWLLPSVFITGFLMVMLCMMIAAVLNKMAEPRFTKYTEVSVA